MGLRKSIDKLKALTKDDIKVAYPRDMSQPLAIRVEDTADVNYTPPQMDKLAPLEEEDIVVSYPEDRNPNIINDLDLEEEPEVKPASVPVSPAFSKLGSSLKAPVSSGDFNAPLGSHPLDPFLKSISQVESAGGKYTKHKLLTKGMHKGFSAYGKYGLMPLTMQEVGRELANKQSLLAQTLGPKANDPQVLALANMDPHKIKDYVRKTPGLEDKLARYIAIKAFRGTKDPLQAAYRWNQGTSLSQADLPKDYTRHDYVQKFLKATNKGTAKPNRIQSSIPNKSMPLTSNEDDTEEGNS